MLLIRDLRTPVRVVVSCFAGTSVDRLVGADNDREVANSVKRSLICAIEGGLPPLFLGLPGSGVWPARACNGGSRQQDSDER